jgi:adenylate cyclase class IV
MNTTNAEIKAICHNLETVRMILQNLRARFVGQDQQTDTYFNVPDGRLKLREGRIENALIYYRRPDSRAPKISDSIISSITDGTKPLLTPRSALK